MTERLYYTDPTLIEFTAAIVDIREDDGIFKTALDRTAFYPTSGGQQFDTGFLNEAKVIDVIEEAEVIWHLSESGPGKVGDSVSGIIDKDRRMKHRQQHTAQHIISQIAYSEFNYGTVSVHLGDEYGLVEFPVEEIPDEQLKIIQDRANVMVMENIPVRISFVEGDEIEKVPFRREPKRSGRIRVIQIGEKEFSACGGTHCTNTGEVMLVKIIGSEKVHGNAGIKFLSGKQAIADYDTRFEITDNLSKTLTCNISELESKFDRLAEELKEAKLKISELQRIVLPLEAKKIASNSIPNLKTKFVFEEIEGFDAKTAGKFARVVAEELDGVAVLINGNVLHIGSQGIEAGKIAKVLVEKFGLKGGGGPTQAQVAGVDVSKYDSYRDVIIEYIN